jgi:hypothetical protein
LWAELLGVFVLLPLLIYLRVLPNWPIPILVACSLVALTLLWRDPTFDRQRLTMLPGSGWRNLLLRSAVLCAAIGAGVWLILPDKLFDFVRRAPLLWAAVLVLYPLLSVYPQELLYRAWFMHRYRPLFASDDALMGGSALLFGFVHVIFGHWVSVALTSVGGLLFARTYLRTGSLAAAAAEHAIFGDFMFTIGLGQYFYHGASSR